MIFYRIALQIYYFLVRLAAWFVPKARAFVAGRRDVFRSLATQLADNTQPVVWVHCASLGEFEQGRPLIEAIRQDYPRYRIVLTFFSPSGYEIRKNYPLAEAVSYLPLDSPQNARRFIALVQPRLAFFVKYEFWYFYLRELHRQGIPAISVAAIFREQQFFFRWYGGFGRKTLQLIQHFFVQDKPSAERLHQIGISTATVSGDTRLDRVARIRETPQTLPNIARFLDGKPAFVIGSAWPEDLSVLRKSIAWLVAEGWKIIIAPHEIDAGMQSRITTLLPTDWVRFSEFEAEDAPVLLLDTMGMLAHSYAYGALAYVGGAFGKGLHNTMEAAVHGVPVLFGNKNYQKFREARHLITEGGGFALSDAEDALQQIRELATDAAKRKSAGQQAAHYVQRNRGATQRVLDFCQPWLTKE